MTYDALNRLTTRSIPSVTYGRRSTQGIANVALLVIGRRAYPYYPTNPVDSSLTIPGDVETFGCDALGNLTRADNGDALVRRGYFPTGQIRVDTLIIKTYTGRDTTTLHRYVIGHQYDLDARETVLKHPAQLAPQGGSSRDSVVYQYDAIGQVATVAIPGQGYSPLGNQNRNLLPSPTRLSTARSPPNACASCRETLNPNPAPPVRRVAD